VSPGAAVEGPKDEKEVALEYRSKAELQEAVKKLHERTPIDADEHTRLLLGVPDGGRLSFMVQSMSETAANPRNYQVQVLDAAGKEIARGKGRDEKPERPVASVPFSAAFSVDLPAKWEGKITVKVFYSPAKKMRIYTVRQE